VNPSRLRVEVVDHRPFNSRCARSSLAVLAQTSGRSSTGRPRVHVRRPSRRSAVRSTTAERDAASCRSAPERDDGHLAREDRRASGPRSMSAGVLLAPSRRMPAAPGTAGHRHRPGPLTSAVERYSPSSRTRRVQLPPAFQPLGRSADVEPRPWPRAPRDDRGDGRIAHERGSGGTTWSLSTTGRCPDVEAPHSPWP